MKYQVNLNVRSHYSFLTSTIKIIDYINFAKNHKLSTLALVDRNVMYGAYEFYRLCCDNNIKPIIGLNCIWESTNDKIELTILATTFSGYQKLMVLTTIISTNKGTLTSADVRKYLHDTREVIVIIHVANQNLRFIKNFYDIVKNNNYQLVYFGVTSADISNIPILSTITSDIVPVDLVLYLESSHHIIYQVCQAIKDQKQLTPEQLVVSDQFLYKDSKTLNKLYPSSIIKNLEKLVLMCDLNLDVKNNQTIVNLPTFPCPNNLTSSEYLQELCKQGLEWRFQSREIWQTYAQRILYELRIIKEMGFSDYFLIVNDYVNFARSQKIMVGPGRGSVAGSLVAYVLGITDVDPIKYQLIFERFLNPERLSWPDIDIDFEDTRREEVINYIFSKYGRDHAAYIVTFQTIASKMALRDCGRVFGVASDDINEMTKLVPLQYNFDITTALKQSAKLSWYAQKYPLLFQLTKQMIGLARQTSTHAAGIIIANSPLLTTVPLQLGFDGNYQTQYPMHDLATLGLIKMDILGLRNLTILQNILQKVSQYYFLNLNLTRLPLDDKRTLELLKTGDTAGIFQLESPGMRQLIVAMKADSFEDIVAASSLFRPGPSDYINTYIACKLGQKAVSYIHEDLVPFLASTYGIILYQEQILLILQKIAGYSLAKADIIRRAISKKDEKMLHAQGADFIKSALVQGYSKQVAHKIWADIAKFANYGFNRSHAVAYSLISYYLLYLKANFPLAFMVCLLSSVIGNDQKMLQYLHECQKYNIKMLPPSVQFSDIVFTIDVNNEGLRYGLQAVKQMSQATCYNLISERNENGYFRDFFNFCARALFVGLNRKNIEYLIFAGALDDLEPNRTMLLANLDSGCEYAHMVQLHIKTGEEMQKVIDFSLVPAPVMRIRENDFHSNSINEQAALGFYLKYNPQVVWQQQLDPHHKAVNLAAINNYLNQYVHVYGIVIDAKTINTKNNKMMAFLQFQNDNVVVEVTVFDRLYQKYQQYCQINEVFLMEAKVEIYKEKIRLLMTKIIKHL